MFKLVFLIQVILLIGACSNIPETIRHAPEADIQLSDVQKDFSSYQDSRVRWGGTLLEVENTETATTLQILAYPLRYYGRPNISSVAQGRFIAQTTQFLDPKIYTKDAEITVTGKLTGQAERQIDTKTIKLPVIDSSQIYLWPKYRRRNDGYGYCDLPPDYWNYRYGGYGGYGYGGYGGVCY